ncbi:hypothetical protein SFUMM280S_01549 [Streptomyces fumanus]
MTVFGGVYTVIGYRLTGAPFALPQGIVDPPARAPRPRVCCMCHASPPAVPSDAVPAAREVPCRGC